MKISYRQVLVLLAGSLAVSACSHGLSVQSPLPHHQIAASDYLLDIEVISNRADAQTTYRALLPVQPDGRARMDATEPLSYVKMALMEDGETIREEEKVDLGLVLDFSLVPPAGSRDQVRLSWDLKSTSLVEMQRIRNGPLEIEMPVVDLFSFSSQAEVSPGDQVVAVHGDQGEAVPVPEVPDRQEPPEGGVLVRIGVVQDGSADI